jgi:hypothetical protein
MKDSEVSMNGSSGDAAAFLYKVVLYDRWAEFWGFEASYCWSEVSLDRVAVKISGCWGDGSLTFDIEEPFVEQVSHCHLCRRDESPPHLHLKFGKQVVGSLTRVLTGDVADHLLTVPAGIEGDHDSVVSPARTLPDLDVSSHDDENITT